ncbi:hypothetical protein Agabi119p4_7128 [Agaricus bisporus var. burnettii]|uniref:PEBP-like protein n=1 Tax=Agaricus bisporus var. burnettii TaxID=192524 RepID=A0A8H7EZ72_AGABI|nr:hypothetical protein Agabi119p4_7128 [Agaricus bisporus var. burnettii]
MRLSLTLLSLFTLLVGAQDTSIRDVRRAFADANIPEDLSINFEPTALLQVTFPQGDSDPITLHAGVQLRRDSTAGPPTYAVSGTSCPGPFVIASVDPDAPTPQTPTSSQIRHFLGGNFFPRGSDGMLSNSTAAVSGFRQPTPPAGSDAHRYIFLLFEQPEGFNDQTVVTPETPISLFNISAFAAEVGLGDPIAGTFMLVAPNPTA